MTDFTQAPLYDRKLRRHSAWWLRVIYGVLAVSFLYACSLIYRQLRVSYWPEVAARVTHVGERVGDGWIDGEEGRSLGLLQWDIAYEYEVDGVSYRGDRWNPSPFLLHLVDLNDDLYLQLEKGGRIWIRHRPDVPATAYVSRIGLTVFPIGLAVLSGVTLFALFHFEHTHRKSS